MCRRIWLSFLVVTFVAGPAQAQFVVIDPGESCAGDAHCSTHAAALRRATGAVPHRAPHGAETREHGWLSDPDDSDYPTRLGAVGVWTGVDSGIEQRRCYRGCLSLDSAAAPPTHRDAQPAQASARQRWSDSTPPSRLRTQSR